MTKLDRAFYMALKVIVSGVQYEFGLMGRDAMYDLTNGVTVLDPTNTVSSENSVNPADYQVGTRLDFFSMPVGTVLTCGKNTMKITEQRFPANSNNGFIRAEIYLSEFNKTYDTYLSDYPPGEEEREQFFAWRTNNASQTGSNSYLVGSYMFYYQEGEDLYLGAPCLIREDHAFTTSVQSSNIYMHYKINSDGSLIPQFQPEGARVQFHHMMPLFWFFLGQITTDDKPFNPYEPGGPSGPGGGGGTWDDDSDIIGIPLLPSLSSANTGFTRIYNPTLAQVQDLARYLWTDDSVIETIWNHIKQFFENPMDAIIGFNLVPVRVPDGGTKNFALMYIDTGVSMTVAANQFVDVDCGELQVEPYYGSALDYSPHTKISCFLPFIGTVSLNVDEVMGKTLKVVYRVDICSGSCVAYITVDSSVLYQYSGHCAITIPLASADFSSYVSAAISVGKLAAAAITAGAGAAMAAGVAEASQQTNKVVTTTQVTSTARNPSTGRQITTGTTTTVQTRESPADQSSTQASFSGLSPQNVANTVGAIMSSKPHIEHSGSFSGNSGYLGVRRPFVIIERPNMCMPANYQALNGFPAMITMELSTCKGFTRVQQVQLTGMGRATNPEQAEILELLKSGVIL